MQILQPETPLETAALLGQCAEKRQSVNIRGNSSKDLWGGPVVASDCVLSTAGLAKIQEYEPRDLTIRVEAGASWAALQQTLAQNRQMIALDVPLASKATVGGVIAANLSGPQRLRYGTARDLVIGMEIATIEGKLVRTGGMVVKNVAGLDIAKTMIGSYGTLAVITSVNFRLHSIPEDTKTFLYTFPNLEDALERRNRIQKGVLQPLAMDLLSPATSLLCKRRGYLLAIRAGGSHAVLTRYERELSDAETLSAEEEGELWETVREFPAEFLSLHAEGVVVKVPSTFSGIGLLPSTVSGAFIARAGSGVTYFYFPMWSTALPFLRKLQARSLPATVECAPLEVRSTNELWLRPPSSASDSAYRMMERVKGLFDPQHLLNRQRLYGCL